MQYVGTNNKRPGPAINQPSVHEQAYLAQKVNRKADADREIAQGVEVYATVGIEIELLDWAKIEHLLVARSQGSEGVFIIQNDRKEAAILKAMVQPAS